MDNLRVATFNTHWGVDFAGVPYDAARAIAMLEADLVALQECWRPAPDAGYVAEAAKELGMEVVWGPFVGGPHGGTWRRVHGEDETEASFGVAVMSRFPILSRRLIPLGKMPGDMNRALLEVVADVNGRPLRFAAVHLCMLPHGSLFQLLQARALLHASPGEAAVCAGDFNMWGPVVERLVGRRRAMVAKTWPSHRPHSQIDHVLLHGPLHATDGEVLPPLGSDHRALRVGLRWS